MNPEVEVSAPVQIPFPLKRLLIRLGVWLVLAAGILFGVIVWWCASEIAEPPRRSVSEASRAFFDGTANAGFKVEEFESTDGMPFLICTPEVTKTFSKKAGIIRGQLADKGLTLQPSGKIIGTMLILHGRSGMKEDYLAVAERFCAVGFRCVIPDLPGHGANERRFTTYGVLEAPMILKCFNEAAVKFGFAEQPCVILGQSMGGAEAVHVAARDDSRFASMVVVSSFDKLETVVRSQTDAMLGSVLGPMVSGSVDQVFRWKTGVRISQINSMAKAQNVRIPTLVIHGDADTMVPTASGKKLYLSFKDDVKKQWLIVPDAGHNNILVTDFPLYATMAEWFLASLTLPEGG